MNIKLYEEAMDNVLLSFETQLRKTLSNDKAGDVVFRFLYSRLKKYKAGPILEALIREEVESIMKEYKTDDEELRLKMHEDVTKLIDAADVLRRRALNDN